MPSLPDAAAASSPATAGADAALSARWRASQRATVAVLVAWVAVTFGVAYFARELSVAIFGWPLSFWVAAQGALLVYLGLVLAYALRMRHLDAAAGIAEDG